MLNNCLRCFFCKLLGFPTALYNYKHGQTGIRGPYRRRMCDGCVLQHHDQIRSRWLGK